MLVSMMAFFISMFFTSKYVKRQMILFPVSRSFSFQLTLNEVKKRIQLFDVVEGNRFIAWWDETQLSQICLIHSKLLQIILFCWMHVASDARTLIGLAISSYVHHLLAWTYIGAFSGQPIRKIKRSVFFPGKLFPDRREKISRFLSIRESLHFVFQFKILKILYKIEWSSLNRGY